MRTKRKASPASFAIYNDDLYNTETAIVVASSSSTPTTAAGSHFAVPDHWIVEKRRRTRGQSAGLVDKYYYEPETGRKFRSLRSIERYLLQSERKPPAPKLLEYGKKEESPTKRKITTMTSNTSRTSRDPSFQLPEGWIVEECVRASGVSAGKIDRYYRDPEIGLKFRSLKSVEDYLAESKNNTPALKMLPFDEKEKLFHKKRTSISILGTEATSFNLPEGWVVEEYFRTSGFAAGRVVKAFFEPGTGRKFQSLQAVKIHLAQMDGSLVPTRTESIPDNYNMLSSADIRELIEKRDSMTVSQSFQTAKASNFYSTLKESSSSSKKKICESIPSYCSNEAPTKVKWVYSNNGGDRWSPFVDESMVPDFEQQQWAKLFVSTVDEEILMHKFRS